jgi:hypothetical protein
MNTIKRVSILFILIVSMFTFPSAMRTFVVMNQVNYSELSNSGILVLLNRLQRPHEGEIALPREVQVMVGMLRSHKITSFRYSKAIGGMELIWQRLSEGAYPIRVSSSSHYLVMLSSEKLPPHATVVSEEEGVILAYCP